MERTRVIEAKEAAYRANVGALTPMAGLIELLEFCDKRALARAVVTNAPRANAELVIGALGLKDRLPILVCSPELERGKPDPLPYLTGPETHRRAGEEFGGVRGFAFRACAPPRRRGFTSSG